ncbi:TPA: type IV secretion system DNA-binding domain-containing protein [Burkholderia vietnamiensis]|nr:type IV secretion system DNA-binding domain-containing protein [Burkholderia vietnamiensis]HDR9210675.1 type IV secretion system DNA-binding domain-containing protein [Burkholderia vietnamiensis]
MSEQHYRQAMGVFPIFKQGIRILFLTPKDIYDFFDKGTRFHFLRYVAMLDALYCLYLFLFAVLTGGHYLLAIVFTALSAGGLYAVSNVVDRIGGWFSWYPGLGYRTSNGTFKPLFARSSLAGSGAAKAGETHVRGSAVFDGAAMAKEMKRGAGNADLSNMIQIGGVPVPPNSEQQHFLFSGAPGAGKTQSINALLRTVRARGQAALIADPAGGYLSRFYRSGDLVLNPFDVRSEDWSPFAEIRHPYDCMRIAKAAIPDAPDGKDGEWQFYAQTLLCEALRSLHEQGNNSVKELLRLVMSAEAKELATILAGTAAATLTAKGNEKMLSNTRAIAAVYLNPWTYLNDGGTFSLRAWVQKSDTNGGKWLFLPYRAGQLAMLKNLLATWLDLAQSEGLELSESRSRRLWFVMDELDSLGKVGTLKMGLTQLRKYGGVVVAGLQFLSQLQTTYGKEEAKTLIAGMATKLVLRVDDDEGVEAMSKILGDQEVIRAETSNSTSTRAGELPSTSENNSTRNVEQRTVMASEISTLPDLHGFLKLPGLPIARVQLEYVPAPELFPAFVAKEAA